MMPSPPIQHRTETRDSSRLAPGSAPARAHPQDWPAIVPQILSSNLRSARSRQHAPPRSELQRSNRRCRLTFPNTPAAAKSP
jgi:hypothetical protein